MDIGLNIKMRFPPEDHLVVEPLSAFILSFVQALLKTGYYQSNHPGSTTAKRGLYQEWVRLDKKEQEISVILQNTGKEEEIIMSGVLSEAVSLKLLFLPSVADIFIPKIRQYFNRRHLMSFTLKPGILREEFEGFVDMMTDVPTLATNAQVMAETTQKLVDLKIVHVSVVYMEDAPLFERPMHWMARVVLTRLGKDLRMVPLYKHLTPEQINALKVQIFKEILRPITNWTILKDVLINCNILQSSNKGETLHTFIEEELYRGLNQDQNMGLLIEATRALGEIESRADTVLSTSTHDTRLISVIQGVLHHLPEGAESHLTEDLLETLLAKKIVLLEDLPQASVDAILTKRKTDDYLKQKGRYWRTLHDGWPQDAQPLFSILSVLLTRDDFYAFGELLDQLHCAFVKTFGSDAGFLEKSGIAFMGETILVKMQARRLSKRKEMLLALEPFAGALAPWLFPLCAHEDLWLRRNICRILADLGAENLPALMSFAQEGRKDWTLIRNVVMIVGDVGVTHDPILHFLKRCQQHPHIRVREEVINSYGKIKGPFAEIVLLQILNDPNPALISRAVLALAHFDTLSERYLAFLHKALRKKHKNERAIEPIVQVACCLTLESLALVHPDLAQSFEPILCSALTPEKSFLGWMRKDQEKEEEVKKGIFRLLGLIGTRVAIPALTACLTHQGPEGKNLIQQALQKIEQRLP